MGGASFLLNKKFHPARLDNQKSVFLAEEKLKQKKQREEEAAKEIMKEKEMMYYENLGDIKERDARQSSLKFMYAVPSVVSKHNPVGKNGSNEDPLVEAFWNKVKDKQNNTMPIENSSKTSLSSRGDIMSSTTSTSTSSVNVEKTIETKEIKKRNFECEEEDESDPEAEFLATLTSREKKLLLRKLQKLQESQS